VVVTNVGEIPAIIQNGNNGFIVHSTEIIPFYHALVALLDNKTLQNNFGKALYATIEEGYSSASVIEKYLNWLKVL
jgi:glycosyltransferase involved in cell wall biosynthesis